MPILRNPALPAGQTIDVDESRMPVLAKSGWIPADDPDPETDQVPDNDPDHVGADPTDPALAGQPEE